MKARTVHVVWGPLLALTLAAVAAPAQQGHPLEGTWQGLWGETPDARNFLTLILRWNGDSVVGTVNPGRNEGAVRSVVLDSSTWTVRFDLDVPNPSTGETVRVRGEGRLLDIGSPKRTVSGTLGDDKPDSYFRISRQ